MAYDLGTARGVIEMSYNGAGVKAADADMASLEKKGLSTEGALKKTGKTAGLAGAAIAAGLGFAVNAAANFEQRMSGIAAVSGANQKQLEALRGKALQLGKDTQFSASEAASAIEELVKAGIPVADVLNGAADAAVNLAAAGGIDIPQAATIAANAMNAFNIPAKQLNDVVDNIAGAANASAIDVGDFGESLQQVGAIAHLAGVNFKDTSTAIAIMGNAGIRGSDAGTSLKTMFQRLNPVTKKASEEMKNLGLITKDGSNRFYDAEGRTKSLAKVSQILQNSLKGMTKQQKQAALQILFGSDAIRGAAILSDAGAKGFDKMAKSMGKVSAADVAKKRMDNLKGSIEQMKGSLETAGIAIGTVLIPPLRQLVDALTQALNWFLNLSAGQQKAITFTLAAVAGILLLVAAIIKIVRFVQEAIAVFEVLQTAIEGTWLAALGPAILIVAAIAAIIVIIILLWKHSETFRKIVTAAWEGVKSAVSSVANWFKSLPGFFSGIWKSIQAGVGNLVSWIKSHWLLLLAIFGGPLGAIIALIIKFWPQITGAFSAGINFIKGIWGGFWGSAFGNMIKAVLGIPVAILKLFWVIVKGLFLLGLMGVRAIVVGAFNAIVKIITVALNMVKGVIRAAMAVVHAIVRAVMAAVRAAWSAAWGAIVGIAKAVWGRIGGTVTAGANHAKSVVVAAWNALRNLTSAIWNRVLGVIKDTVGKIGNVVGEIKKHVTDALAGAATWLSDKGKEIIQGLIDGITSMSDKVTGAIGKITGGIGKFLPGSPVKEGPLKVLNRGHAGKQIVQMVIDGIDKMVKPLQDAVGTATAAGVAPAAQYATPTVAPTGIRQRAKRGGDRRMSRMIDGELRLSESGRAFIRGVAEDVVDGSADYHDTLRRMG